MPIYVYRCTVCGKATEDFRPVPEPRVLIECSACGQAAERSYSDERVNTDMIDNERWSESMGVAPNQVAEARRLFPDSTYDKQGRLLIRSRSHKKQELKRRGYAELD